MEEINDKMIAEVEYDITLNEEDMAFRTFQKKYVYKKIYLQTMIFALLAIMFAYQGIRDTSYSMAWVFCVIAIAFVFVIWYNPRKVRKNLLAALTELRGDKYNFKLSEEFFSIKTIFVSGGNYDEDSSDDDDEEDDIPTDIPEKIVSFDSENVEIIENEMQFIILLKKQTIYTIPKRCMSVETAESISAFFKEKLANEYSYAGNNNK